MNESRTKYRVGVDVGGTFTDLYLLDEASGNAVRHKLPSSPDRPHRAPITGLVEILEMAGAEPAEVAFVGLGTTVATNALLERKGAVTGLLTTRGFRDLLEIGRQKRPQVYDLFARKPPPLIPRERRLDVDERMAADGTVVRPLDAADLTSALERLLASGVESIAICFLNSYVDPAHEQLAAALIRERWPDGTISASQALLPEFREYERLSSTVVNAYLMPRMKSYLARFATEVQGLGCPELPFIMNSGGGVVSPQIGGERPIDTLFSGPSGGVSGAAYLAGLAGRNDIVTLDMGGTSTDVCLIRGGRPDVTTARTIDGLPVRSLAVDVHTVGAGGSSIAWVDSGGLLRVGPHSAGAAPGPACYGTGGEDPTVTDANVVLGRLNSRHLLGGALPIDAQRAHAALDRAIAAPRGTDVNEAAAAVLAVTTTSIAQAIRVVSVERGLDPGSFGLVAFGGAGPLHAADVARELGMAVLVPESPGVLCAMGVLTKDVQLDFSQTRIFFSTASGVTDEVGRIYSGLEDRALDALDRGGLDTRGLIVERALDARYVGQNFELSVPVPAGPIDTAALRSADEAFHEVHRRMYGYDQRDKEIELVTFRIAARLPVARPELRSARRPSRRGGPRAATRRPVFFEAAGGFVDCPVHDREELDEGDRLEGPAVIEQMDTTTVVPPDFRLDVDGLLNLHLTSLRLAPTKHA